MNKFKKIIFDRLMKLNPNIKVDNVPLINCWEIYTLEDLRNIESLIIEPSIVKRSREIWETGSSQEAYDYFLQFKNNFISKIRLAEKLIKTFPNHIILFFGDEYPLNDIDPIELSLCFSTYELEKIYKDLDGNFISKFPYRLEPLDIQLGSRLNVEKPFDAVEEEGISKDLYEISDLLLLEENVQQFDVLPSIHEIVEEIFITAMQKGVKFLRSPININFELDDVDDIVNNFSEIDIIRTLEELRAFENTSNKSKEMFNTLEVARKYLNGKIYEEEEQENWSQYAPRLLKFQIENLPLEEAYSRVLSLSKSKSLDSKSKKKVMDYRFYLEELIFGERKIFQEEEVKEEFKEYPFEEYVRHAVEAIILPHIEVLDKIVANNGGIQFVDVWSENFSDSLKQEVKERDQFKCVICDEETNLHVHHKIPRKYGGVNHRDNLVTLCSSCHGAVETADFEHAYNKGMLNAIKGKTSLQKPIDLSKDIYILKGEVKNELDDLFLKMNIREEALSHELLQIMKKIDYIFES